MPENTQNQWEHSTPNTYKPATNKGLSRSGTPPVPDKLFDVGQNSSTTSSFTQLKVLKQWRHSEQSTDSFGRNIDTFMSRLHELFKQGQKFPHKSDQHIHVNTSDSYCLQPTAVTSDFTAMSAYTYSDIQEEQPKATDLKRSHLVSVRSVKKSLIPVRSASRSCYIRRSLTDTFARHSGHEWDLAERRSSTTSDVANITLPTDSHGSGTTKSHLPKAAASLHPRATTKTKHASLMGQEHQLDQSETLFNSFRTSRTKISATTSMSEARWRDYSTAGTDEHHRAWHQLSCGDSGADAAIKSSQQNTDSCRIDRPESCKMPSHDHGSLLHSFCRTNEEVDTNKASRWETTRKQSLHSLSPASFVNQQKSSIAGHLPRDEQAALTSTSFKTLNVINSMKPEDCDTKKEMHGDEILAVKQRRLLGPRSRSCIPVRKRTPSNEKPPQHRFRHNCGTIHLGKFNGVSTVSHSSDRNTRGKKPFVSQRTTSRESTADIASSAMQIRAQAVKTDKPPLPRQRFRSNMSNVKSMTSKSTSKRELSMQTSFPEVHLQTSSVTSLQTGLWAKQSPCTRNRSVATEPQSPKLCCKPRTHDCSAFRLLTNGSTSLESLRLTASKSSFVTTQQNSRQLNPQTNDGNISVQQSVLKSVVEPVLKFHETSPQANKITSKPKLQRAESADKQRQFSQQRLVKSTQTNNVKLKQTLHWQQSKQRQSKQIEISLSPKRHQIQDARGGKMMTPIMTPLQSKSYDKKSKNLSTVEEKTHMNNDKGSNVKITELQKSTSKQPQCSGPANKDSEKEVVAVKGLQPHEDAPIHTPVAISNSPREKPGKFCPKKRNVKHSTRSKCGLNCKKQNKSKVPLYSGNQSGRHTYKNTSGKDDDGQPVCSVDTLNTDNSTSDTDCQPDETSPGSVHSPSRPSVVQQKSESRKKAHERETKSRSVAWNMSESEVLIKTSRRQKGKRKTLALTENKTKVRTSGFLRNSAPAGAKRASAEDAQAKPKLNKNISSPHRSETKGYVNNDLLLSVRMGKTLHSCQPQVGRNKQQSLSYQDWLDIKPDLDKQLGSPADSSKSPEAYDQDDDDEDDKIIQADLEEALIKLYQTQNSLHLRVITLQDSIKQLRAGLFFIQQSPKADSKGDFQWEGTIFDYLMLLGFMVVQFCIQYLVMSR